VKKFLLVLSIIVVVALVVAGAWFLGSSGLGSQETPESITLGNMLYEYSGLVFIADDRGFFAANGLNVTLRDYVSTVASITGLENNETDITLVPEYSIVTEAFKKENITVIGNSDKYESVFLISRKDRGIENVSDLKGRKIGGSKGTIGEFYLGRFLELNGMRIEDVTFTDMPTTQYVETITNGSVDAVIVVYKYLDQSREQLGSNLVAWPIQSSQKGYVVLTCRNDWASSHPETIIKVLKSVKQAEDYAITHPAEARAIIQKRMNYTDTAMADIWPDHEYALTLDQSLITAMEDEARWMIANNLTNATEIPDFRKYISTEGLKAVKPGSVRIHE
jgi:NitT/TauT family transport system substrate-binding protein